MVPPRTLSTALSLPPIERSQAAGLATMLTVALPVAPWLALVWAVGPWRGPHGRTPWLQAVLLVVAAAAEVALPLHTDGSIPRLAVHPLPVLAAVLAIAPLLVLPRIGGPWRDRRLRWAGPLFLWPCFGFAPALFAGMAVAVTALGGFDLPLDRDDPVLCGGCLLVGVFVVIGLGLRCVMLFAVGAALALLVPRDDPGLAAALEERLGVHDPGYERIPGPARAWRLAIRGQPVEIQLDQEGRPPLLHLHAAGAGPDSRDLHEHLPLTVTGLGLGPMDHELQRRATHRLDDLIRHLPRR